jgi:hypothetical protein
MAAMKQTQTGISAVSWRTAVWQVGVHFIGVLALLGVFGLIVPRFGTIFEEFDYRLPVLTILVVNMSNSLVQRWFLAVPIVLIFMAFDLAVLAALHCVPNAGPSLGSLWFVLGLVLLGLIVLLTVAGLILPLSGIVNDLS